MGKNLTVIGVISVTSLLLSACSNTTLRSPFEQRTGGDAVNRTSSSTTTSGSTQQRRGWFSQSRQNSSKPVVCQPCGTNNKPQANYTYKPAPAPKPVVTQPQQTGKSQQWYVDRWKKQQAQPQTKPATNTNNYVDYASGSTSNTTYYDYSTAGNSSYDTNNKQAPATTSAATSNKSIYTGSYQQQPTTTYKPYKPTTYAAGSAATTPATSTGGSTYTVKKGDTVFEVMLQTGVYWKDIISINGLQPPYTISPGQTLKLK